MCACDSKHFGDDCEFDVCAAAGGLQPGLAVSYYDDGNGERFHQLAHTSVARNVNINTGGEPFPQLPNDGWSVAFAGFLRPYVSGLYEFQCATSQGSCTIIVDGRVVTNGVQFNLTRNTNTRLKVEYTHGSFTAVCQLRWRMAGQSSFAAIPDRQLLHQTYCDGGGCQNGGCCIATDQCQVCAVLWVLCVCVWGGGHSFY